MRFAGSDRPDGNRPDPTGRSFGLDVLSVPAFAYLLVALRHVFGGGWLGTAVREAVLLTLHATAFSVGMLFLLGTGLSEL